MFRKRSFAPIVVSLVCLLAMVSAVPRPLFADTRDEADPAPAFGGWQIVGPSGGDVRVVTIDPRNKDHLFISTLDGQVYTSIDAGKSCRLLVNLNRPQLILDQLMVDSRDSNVIYTSGHRYKAPGGFFVTRDGGTTW